MIKKAKHKLLPKSEGAREKGEGQINEGNGVEEGLPAYRDHLETLVKSRTVELIEANEKLESEIIERKKADRALRESEERYRAVFDQAGDSIVLIDAKTGAIVEFNERAHVNLDYTREEFEKIKIRDFEAMESGTDVDRHIEKILRHGRDVFETRHRRKGGEIRDIRVSARAFSIHGKDYLLAIWQDITEHKRAEAALRENEEKYRTLIENSLDGIAVVQGEKVVLVNPALLKMFGFEREEEMIGRPFTDFISPKDQPLLAGNETEKKVKKEVPSRYEFKALRKDGGEFVAEISLSTIPYKGGIVRQGIIRDISEQRSLEAQLYQAQKMEALGTLVAGVAHEINNPINLIMFNVPLLQRIWRDFQPILEEQARRESNRKYGGLTYDFLKENLAQLLSDMDLAANRVTKIVKGLKDFSKRTDFAERSVIQINEAVENAIRLTQSTLIKAKIDLVLDLGDDLPEMEGNLQSVEQIILNLVINAVEAIGDKGGQIQITTDYQKKSEQILVSIKDNGRGIDSSISDRIFDPFVTDRQAEGGTGLGLSVTYNLVQVHDGKIDFQSEKGKGTTFTVIFPIRSKKPAKILVVDDDKTIRSTLAQALTRSAPYEVEKASNGIEALIKLGTYRPDLLILDILMPEMDGAEVCRSIRKEPNLAGMKVLIITGYPSEPKLKDVAKMGFSNIIVKPFDLQTFVDKVDDILRTRGPEDSRKHAIHP
jgi:PAS domain S-box-containing protein